LIDLDLRTVGSIGLSGLLSEAMPALGERLARTPILWPGAMCLLGIVLSAVSAWLAPPQYFAPEPDDPPEEIIETAMPESATESSAESDGEAEPAEGAPADEQARPDMPEDG
jgi:hypothetical protein